MLALWQGVSLTPSAGVCAILPQTMDHACRCRSLTMPRHCTICDRDDRHAIDQALVQGEAFRNVSERCSVSTAAIFRHYHAHIPQHLRQAHAVHEVSQADHLLAKVVGLEQDAKRLQGLAEGAGDLKTALQ